jgi:hypothetical protein
LDLDICQESLMNFLYGPDGRMDRTTRVVLSLLALVLVAGGLTYWVASRKGSDTVSLPSPQPGTITTTSIPTPSAPEPCPAGKDYNIMVTVNPITNWWWMETAQGDQTINQPTFRLAGTKKDPNPLLQLKVNVQSHAHEAHNQAISFEIAGNLGVAWRHFTAYSPNDGDKAVGVTQEQLLNGEATRIGATTIHAYGLVNGDGFPTKPDCLRGKDGLY